MRRSRSGTATRGSSRGHIPQPSAAPSGDRAPIVVAAGFLAGALIAAVAFLAEHYAPNTTGYSLFGNGALIVPAILAPWALYWGWTWTLSRGGRALEMALFVVGLHFGVGVIAVLDVLFYPQQPGLTIADAIPGLALTGTLFVIPGALLAGLTYQLFTRRIPFTSVTVFAAAFIAAVLVVFYWIGLGILAGICVVAAHRDLARRMPIGAALLVLLVVIGNLPYFPAIFGAR